MKLDYISLEDIDVSKPFPSGEPNFQCLPTKTIQSPTLLQRCHNGDDLLKILLCAEALAYQEEAASFFIPFLPTARQDRRCRPGEAFSLKVILQTLRAQIRGRIYTFDCHSPVAEALDDKLISLSPQTFHSLVLEHYEEPPVLVIPDAGAEKRLSHLRHLPHAQALKTRNLSVTDVRLYGDVCGKDCLIVDDICDGGGTFVKLAETLRAAGATDVQLCVSHGLFTAGLKPLKEAGISHVFTTDSWISSNTDDWRYVTCFPLSEVAVI